MSHWAAVTEIFQLLGQHGQVGHDVHCTAGISLLRVVLLCKNPVGAHVTMFIDMDILLELLPILTLNRNPPYIAHNLSVVRSQAMDPL